jgi:hypothetical protein
MYAKTTNLKLSPRQVGFSVRGKAYSTLPLFSFFGTSMAGANSVSLGANIKRAHLGCVYLSTDVCSSVCSGGHAWRASSPDKALAVNWGVVREHESAERKTYELGRDGVGKQRTGGWREIARTMGKKEEGGEEGRGQVGTQRPMLGIGHRRSSMLSDLPGDCRLRRAALGG